ncbi:aldo/keto reductase family protein [Lederbergia galactosidilytica]|uniref:Voltage-gated potassium channel n=1 Tax=Lederbergia galactosidilytica TaxID=217031 RepID=A0A178A443_9BACI|nr:aldo/keto reductase family protein [Lederbergia galactosidilytica]KRG10944.1 voltage-gated potassium channel [Virgibacillus soli]MBP1913802.1 voltage-dependent potassium channel beta subunit [Lederbergia galactosidilytica]OAK73858.1 voltage-gated potassium channel [Lederbergia galactosidilytica]
MKYRRLGKTGLKVSEISLGSWLTYGKSVEDDTATKTIHRAYDLGINFFDSANVYEQGEGEKVLSKALKEFPRESYVITTKAFWPMGERPNDRGLSRKHVYEQVHNSLKRMDLDYVDIFYCHRYDPETPVEETLRVIDDLIRQGKILYAGVSEWTAAQIEEAVGIADRKLLDRIVVNQPVYNMLNRYIEKEVLPVSSKYGIGQVVFSPLAQGILTGKYLGGNIPETSRAANNEINNGVKGMLTEEVLDKVRKLDEVAKELDTTLPALAIAWILRQPMIASALVGASRPEQIEANVKGSELELTADVLDKIEDILA